MSKPKQTMSSYEENGRRKSGVTKCEAGYPRKCQHCPSSFENFVTPVEFGKHIRLMHSTQEGGSFLCRFGDNENCQKLPPEGVCDVDFEAHIKRYHLMCDDVTVQEAEDDCQSLKSVSNVEKRKFSLTSFTQNLSAVLADPGRSRSEITTFFTRHWGDSFTPQTTVAPSKNVPKVSYAQFEKYCRTTGEAYKKYRSIRRALKISNNHCENQKSDEKQDADDLPTIFIDPRFSLLKSETFASVFTIPKNENSDELQKTLSGKNAVPAMPSEIQNELKPGDFRDYDTLQTRLEMMHDIVDGRLATKLVSKTDKFWQVVRSYSGLQEQLALAMKSVKTVRANLKHVDGLICEQSKKIIGVHSKSEQKKVLLAKLHDISCLRDAQSTVQMMLSQGDYPKAIECIETSLNVLSIDLEGVTCFRHLSSQLKELYDMIGRMMNEEFATLIQRELGMKPENGVQIQAEGELSALIMGLMRMRKYSFIGVLRDEIVEGVKNVMRQVVKLHILESGVDLTNFDPSLMQLGEPVRRMKHSQYLSTVKAVMQEELAFCTRLESLQELMLELSDRANSIIQSAENSETIEISEMIDEAASKRRRRQIDSESDSDGTYDDNETQTKSTPGGASATILLSIDVKSEAFLKKILPLVVEFGYQCVQQRLSRLLMARAKNAALTETMTPIQLSEIIRIVSDFLSNADRRGWHRTQSQKTGALGKASNKIIMDYIERFHLSRKVRIGNILDTELWKSIDIPSSFQKMIDVAFDEGNETPKLRNRSMTAVDEAATTASSMKSLRIGDDEYVIVGSCVTMIQILADYCEAVEVINGFAQDWNSRIIELLKVFNSRCCQLILGAGALQLVGLKTISVRNLALAGRSLELIHRVISIIETEMNRALSDDRKTLLRYFKQVRGEYHEHVNEISSKLISVIHHYTTNCLNQWEQNGTIPSSEFQQICRHMLKFHNGLVGIMPTNQIAQLFQRVHQNFKTSLKAYVKEKGITPHDTLRYGYVTKDYMFYQQSMKMMESCRDLQLESLNDILFEEN